MGRMHPFGVVERVRSFCCHPRQHFSELRFEGAVAQDEDVFRFDTFGAEEVVELHVAIFRL